MLRGSLVLKNHYSSLLSQFSSLIIHHSITHHLSLKIPQLPKVACLVLVSNFDNSKNFTFCGTHRLTWCSFYFLFLFSFFLQHPIPKLIELSEKEWKKKRLDPAWKEKKKKKRRRPNWIWLLSNCGSLKYVCIYQNAIITLFP